MGLPLLGLLAMGGAVAGQPYLQNRANRIRGNYIDQGLDDRGVDRNDPSAVANAMLELGVMDAPGFQSQLQNRVEGQLDRANRLQGARISAGPGYARVAEMRRQFDVQLQMQQEQTALNLEMMEAAGLNPVQANLANNQAFYNQYGQNMANMLNGPAPDAGLSSEQIGYYNEFQNAQRANATLQEWADMTTTGQLGQAARARMSNDLALNVQPMVMKALNTGVLNSPEEAARVDKIIRQKGIIGLATSTRASDRAAWQSLSNWITFYGNQQYQNLFLSQTGQPTADVLNAPTISSAGASLPEDPAEDQSFTGGSGGNGGRGRTWV